MLSFFVQHENQVVVTRTLLQRKNILLRYVLKCTATFDVHFREIYALILRLIRYIVAKLY